jgi:hypothetical protein
MPDSVSMAADGSHVAAQLPARPMGQRPVGPVLPQLGRWPHLLRGRLGCGAADAHTLQPRIRRLGPGAMDAEVAAECRGRHCRRGVRPHSRQQAPMRNPPPIEQRPDHAQARRTLAIRHFRHPAALADAGLEVVRGQAFLLPRHLIAATASSGPQSRCRFSQASIRVTSTSRSPACGALSWAGKNFPSRLEGGLEVIVVTDGLDPDISRARTFHHPLA